MHWQSPSCMVMILVMTVWLCKVPLQRLRDSVTIFMYINNNNNNNNNTNTSSSISRNFGIGLPTISSELIPMQFPLGWCSAVFSRECDKRQMWPYLTARTIREFFASIAILGQIVRDDLGLIRSCIGPSAGASSPKWSHSSVSEQSAVNYRGRLLCRGGGGVVNSWPTAPYITLCLKKHPRHFSL